MSRILLKVMLVSALILPGTAPRLSAQIQGTVLDDTEAARKSALLLASAAHIKKYGPGGLDANERSIATPFRIGYDAKPFARAGETVWEVRYLKTELGAQTQHAVRAVFWVNVLTKQVEFISGPEAGEKLSTLGAITMARQWYEREVGKPGEHCSAEANEYALDYEIPGFAKRGTPVVEVRLSTEEGLRGMVLVDLRNRLLHPLTGVWQPQPLPKAAATTPTRTRPEPERPPLTLDPASPVAGLLAPDREARRSAAKAIDMLHFQTSKDILALLNAPPTDQDTTCESTRHLAFIAAGRWGAEDTLPRLMENLYFRIDPATVPVGGMRSSLSQCYPAAVALSKIGGKRVVDEVVLRARAATDDTQLRVCASVLQQNLGRTLALARVNAESASQEPAKSNLAALRKLVDSEGELLPWTK